jgi:hypothetical protein
LVPFRYAADCGETVAPWQEPHATLICAARMRAALGFLAIRNTAISQVGSSDKARMPEGLVAVSYAPSVSPRDSRTWSWLS